MAQWLNILNELQNKLTDDAAADKVVLGAMIPEDYVNDGSTAVFLIRNKEYNETIKNMHVTDTAVAIIYIECWCRQDDANPSNSYHTLATIEDNVINSLRSWLVTRNNNNFQVLSLDIDEIIGDGDSKRPLLGSRMTINIEYAE